MVASNLIYGLHLNGTIKVIFDGQTFICNKKTDEEGEYWGADYNLETDEYDFSEYPFVLYASLKGTRYLFAQDGTHSLSISQVTESSAEWTLYGEKGSGSGEMINVYFLNTNKRELYSDYTTQIAEDGSIILPDANMNGSNFCWQLNKSKSSSLDDPLPTYDSGDSFSIPEPTSDYIFTEDPQGELTAPFIVFNRHRLLS